MRRKAKCRKNEVKASKIAKMGMLNRAREGISRTKFRHEWNLLFD